MMTEILSDCDTMVETARFNDSFRSNTGRMTDSSTSPVARITIPDYGEVQNRSGQSSQSCLESSNNGRWVAPQQTIRGATLRNDGSSRHDRARSYCDARQNHDTGSDPRP